jgi:mediator of RNA polymerase II transcription subunit 21
MDIITQLQDQLDEMAVLAVNTFGTLQRDAPPDRLSNSYPDPLNPNPKPEDDSTKPQVQGQPGAPPPAQAQPPAPDLSEQPKAMSHALVLAAKKVGTLPLYSSRPPPPARPNAQLGIPKCLCVCGYGEGFGSSRSFPLS